MRSAFCALSLLGVLAGTWACSSDDDGVPAHEHPSVVKPDASPVTVQGNVTEVTAFAAVPNASVCVLASNPPNCATTDDAGFFSLETSSDDEIALDITAPDLVRTLVVLGSRDGDGYVDARTFASSALDGLVDVLGVPADPTKGHLLLLKSTEGGTATLSTGDTPVYFGPGGVPVTGTTTGKGGGVGFFNVAPGTVEFGFSSEPSCELPLWTGSQPNGGRVPIEAGALTTISRLYCE